MQGHTSPLTSLPENLNFDHGSMSSDTGIDSQTSWNSMPTSAPNRLEYRLSSSGTNQYPHHLIRHNGQQNAQWSLGETSSSATQNNSYGNEGKLEHHTRNYLSRTALTVEEPSNIISLENNVINLNGNQTTTNGSFILQHSSPDAISQDLNMISGFVEDEDADCQIVEHPNTYTSVGSSSEDRPRISCKRKAPEVQVGPSSGAGTSNTFQIRERSQWNALPADQIAPNNINLPSQIQNEFVFNNSSEQANPRFRLGVGGAVPASPFSLTSSGNAESSQRNLRLRNYSLPQQDPVAANTFLGDAGVGNREVSSSSHSTRFYLRNDLLDLNPVPPMEFGIPPPVRRNPQTRWRRASSSRTNRSSAAPNSVPYEEPAEANISIPRSISEHPIFVPAATEMGSSSEHPTGWNLASGNNSTVGNVISASESGSSSGVNLSAAAWPNRSRQQFPRRLSEMVRRSMLSSTGTNSGGQSVNHAVRASPSLTPQEMALLSGTHSHYRHAPSARSAMLERNLDGAYGGPYSLRTLAGGGEGRSSIMSEIRHVLSLMRRGEGLRIEDVMLLDHSVFYGMADTHDRHREMRLDVDNMSYEELLALEERIGNVCTGLSEEAILKGLKQHKYVDNRSRDQVETEPCSICREEYNDGEDLGRLECGHDYHIDCIKQWLVQKNLCPICKKTGLAT